MIINYDRRPDLNVDQKVQSLAENVQLALNKLYDVTGLEGDSDPSVKEAGVDFVKLKSGLQICWISSTEQVAMTSAYGSLYQGTFIWEFPVPFAEPPAVSVGAVRWGTGASWGTLAGAPSTTQATLRGIDILSRASGDTYINAVAIGRWKNG